MCSPTPASPSRTLAAGRSGSGSGTGRHSPCCVPRRAHPGRHRSPFCTRAKNLDAADVEEADQRGRSAVLDLPDEETYESADAAPGADNDTEEGDTAQRRRLNRFAKRANELEGGKDETGSGNQDRYRALARWLQPDRVLPLHRHRRIRCRASEQSTGQWLRSRRCHRHLAPRRADRPN